MASDAYADLGERLYEWNDLAAAKHSLEQAILLGQQWESAHDQVDGYARLAGVYQAQGQTSDALEAMRLASYLLEGLTQSNRAFPWLPPFVACLEVRLALRQGRLDVAERWRRERAFGDTPYSLWTLRQYKEFEYLTLARILLAQGNLDDAVNLLAHLLQAAENEERMGSVIEVRALQALVWWAQGMPARALDALTQALALAAPEGYVRLFVDEGAPMCALLVRLRAQQPRSGGLRRYLDLLLAAFDHGSAVSSGPREGREPIEPLSEREREVLHLLAQGRSNQEIARQLVVAISTVKTHVHHLFAKLQAADRLQAVTRARELGLLNE
jgi:LuxR family maltose regulon positive regulatory protein